ncbi:MAG: response regulator transcription factor [Anaerolineae bacterium]
MSKHILCIDDDAMMLSMIRLMLEGEGYQVSSAPQGDQGLSLIRKHKPDLVLLDLMMPGRDGWDVCQEIRNDPSLADTPIIVITARSEAIDKVLAFRLARVQDYIAKPFIPQDLLSAVAKVLH